MNDKIFEQMEFARAALLGAAKGVSEAESTMVPNGLNNNILWNLGHVYLVQERILHVAKELPQIPEGFAQFFGGGTKPADWQGQPPSLTEIVELLKQQPTRFREKLQNRLDEQMVEPFVLRTLSMNTLGDVLAFLLFHEGAHVQNIKILRKLAQGEKQ